MRGTEMLPICQPGGNLIGRLEAMATWGSGTRPIEFQLDTTRLFIIICLSLEWERFFLSSQQVGKERVPVLVWQRNSKLFGNKRGRRGLVSLRLSCPHCRSAMSEATQARVSLLPPLFRLSIPTAHVHSSQGERK